MVEKTLIATVTVAANTPANMRQAVSFGEAGKPSVTRVTIPKGRVWVIKDVFIKASGDVTIDGVAIFVKNEVEDIAKTAPLSTMLVSNPSRPTIGRLVYDEQTTLTIDFVNTVAQGSSASSNTFYIIVDDIEKVTAPPKRSISEIVKAAFKV
jgi:hypothetical protein